MWPVVRNEVPQLPAKQGNNREFSRFWAIPVENRPEKICKFSSMRDVRNEFPCATEQGINSSRTGNSIRGNRELIRPNRELARNRFLRDGSNDSIACPARESSFRGQDTNVSES